MLGTRTKQVFAYGKRGHRIVNVSDDQSGGSHAVQIPAPMSMYIKHPKAESTGSTKQDVASFGWDDHRSQTYDSPPSSPETAVKPPRKKTVANKMKVSPKAVKSAFSSPARKPLSAVSSNVPSAHGGASPVQRKRKHVYGGLGKGTPPRVKKLKAQPVSPFVQVDIVLYDDSGTPVKQERRVSRTDVQANVPNRRTSLRLNRMGRSVSDAIEVSDDGDDDDENYKSRPFRKRMKARTVIPSSDEESDVQILSGPPPNFTPKPPRATQATPHASKPQPVPPTKDPLAALFSNPNPIDASAKSGNLKTSQRPQPRPLYKSTAPGALRTIAPFHPPPSRNGIHFSPLVHTGAHNKSRTLTPYKSRLARPAFPAPPSPPSPTTSSDIEDSLSFDISQLALSPTSLKEYTGSLDALAAKPQPAYLLPLLEACSQTCPHEFSAFIEMFPHDPLVHTSHGGVDLSPVTKQGNGTTKPKAHFQKIGEASFSEVFGIGDVVLKVIPLRDEDKPSSATQNEGVETPAPSDVKDVVKEIIVTREMGGLCEGFVQLLRTYVVRGKYPSLLLDLWDEYNDVKGSEGIKPDGFNVSQTYAIIVLPNGGPDLETFSFNTGTKTCWTQACSLFWQVTRTLAEAEALVQFEHRDLHWGQILVKTIPPPASIRVRPGGRVSMDHEAFKVKATVIDLGLSRMQSSEADGVHWTVPDEEIFEGEGDYQFDLYRMMRTHNDNSWKPYRPLTNVMWLHYLVLKLLKSKRLRAPMAPRKPPTKPSLMFTERECWQCLVDMEVILRETVECCKPPSKKGRRKTQAVIPPATSEGSEAGPTRPQNAGEVLQIAIERGWVDE